MRSTLEGKRCLVTGATRGLGRELAKALARAGCSMFLSARDSQALAAIGAELSAPWCIADLEHAQDVTNLIQTTVETIGGIDVLVNCAGIFPISSLAGSSLEEYERCFAINVRAPFQLSRAFAPAMAQQRWGRIVNIGSSSAYAGFKETSIYCASKHALLGFTRALHDELKSQNVRCFCVSPGSIQTDMGHQVKNQDFTTFLDPVELAQFVVELISHDGSMIAEEVRVNRMVIR